MQEPRTERQSPSSTGRRQQLPSQRAGSPSPLASAWLRWGGEEEAGPGEDRCFPVANRSPCCPGAERLSSSPGNGSPLTSVL
ncbi:unnamed protein product [Caretta caretta]